MKEGLTKDVEQAEQQRPATLADGDRQPSPNPRYKGMTPGDAARAILRPRRTR